MLNAASYGECLGSGFEHALGESLASLEHVADHDGNRACEERRDQRQGLQCDAGDVSFRGEVPGGFQPEGDVLPPCPSSFFAADSDSKRNEGVSIWKSDLSTNSSNDTADLAKSSPAKPARARSMLSCGK